MMLAVEGMRFGYGARPILSEVSFAIETGTIVGVMGPNGAGKSTLLRLLGGTLIADAGTIRLGARALQEIPPRERAQRIAIVPQESRIPFSFSALEVVLMGRAPYLPPFGFERHSDIAIAREAMRRTDCEELAERDVTTLSGGEHQRIILARALAQEPQLLLLDEPLGALDIRHSTNFLALLRSLKEREGQTIVCAMHDPNAAAALCDRIVLLADGGIAADGTPETTLTPEIIQRVFGIAMHAGCDEATGRRYLLPTAPAR